MLVNVTERRSRSKSSSFAKAWPGVVAVESVWNIDDDIEATGLGDALQAADLPAAADAGIRNLGVAGRTAVWILRWWVHVKPGSGPVAFHHPPEGEKIWVTRFPFL